MDTHIEFTLGTIGLMLAVASFGLSCGMFGKAITGHRSAAIAKEWPIADGNVISVEVVLSENHIRTYW